MRYQVVDIIIPAFAAGVAGVLSFSAVGPGWSMLPAMMAGMVCGMIAQLPVMLILMPLFGAFEVMLPAMLAGMVSGMVNGMFASHAELSGFWAFVAGSVIGILIAKWVERENNRLQGEAE